MDEGFGGVLVGGGDLDLDETVDNGTAALRKLRNRSPPVVGHLPLREMSPEALRLRPSRRQRKRVKLVQFMACELLALGTMIIGGILGSVPWFPNAMFDGTFRGCVIAAAFAAVALPILFYGLPGSAANGRRR